jgi:hypothetical protein
MFPDVYTEDWQAMRTAVQEFPADTNDGYVNYDASELRGITLNYPKWTSQRGTRISLKNGIWTGSAWDSNRLKLINMPVLKTHAGPGITAALKNYHGVITRGGSGVGFDYHDAYITDPWTRYTVAGVDAVEMVNVKVPDLNIMDALYTYPHPRTSGSWSSYGGAVKTDVIMASTDPVALDYVSAKYVVMPAAAELGYGDLRRIDPDYTPFNGDIGALNVMLSNSRDFLIAGGTYSTLDEAHINLYVTGSVVPSPTPTPTPSPSPSPTPTPSPSPTPSPTPTPINTVQITVNPSLGGSTNPVAGTYEYDIGTPLTFSAVADSDFSFISWVLSDGSNSSSNPYSVTANENFEISAMFEADWTPQDTTVTLTITSTTGGTTSPATGIHVFSINSSQTITAFPNDGYYFDYWHFSNGTKIYTETLSLTMHNPVNVKATFRSITPSPSPPVSPTPEPVPAFFLPVEVLTGIGATVAIIAAVAGLIIRRKSGK